MSVDYQELINRSRCLLCVPELQLEVLAVRIMADLLLTKDPMADVTVDGLLARSRPFINLSKHELLAIMVSMMTDVAVSVANEGVNGAASLADQPYQNGKLVYLIYLNTPGDRMGGWFYYDELSADTHDGFDVIIPTGKNPLDVGRWLRAPNVT